MPAIRRPIQGVNYYLYIFCSMPKTMPTILDELTSDDIDNAMRLLLRIVGPGVGGLQDSVLGQSKTGVSLPKFKGVGSRRFVQVLNVGDHWVTVSNMHTEPSHTVVVYDSLPYTARSHSLVMQVSSLLREEEHPDQIVFRFAPFQKQPTSS